jgi:hypothetical protein
MGRGAPLGNQVRGLRRAEARPRAETFMGDNSMSPVARRPVIWY